MRDRLPAPSMYGDSAMIVVEPTPENKARITARQHELAMHAWAAWAAVRDHDATYVSMPQSTERFRLPADRSTIAIFGDDFGLGTARGPRAFHRPSLARYLGQCATIVLVTSEAVPSMYSIAALTAVALGCCTAVIESLPERETEWLAFIAEVAPGVPLVLCTVEGVGALH